MATVNPPVAFTAPEVLTFLSWNVNGLASAIKKKEHLSKRLNEVHVVFFQETHIGEGNINIIQQLSDWHLNYTTYSTKQRGVAILVNKKVNFCKIKEFQHSDGGYIVLICEIEGQPYTLVSVYNHRTDREILGKLSSDLQEHAKGLLVIGGDFNTIFNPYIDKMIPTTNQDHLELLAHLKIFIRSFQLVDVWRRKVENHLFFTFHCSKNASRIDYFFLPEECLWRVQKCEIEDILSDDHLPICLQLNMEVIAEDPNLYSNNQHRPDCKPSDTFDVANLSISQLCILDEDIFEAVGSLQTSGTPRPNGRPATLYKSHYQIDPETVRGLQTLYNKITNGSFDCQCHQFNESITKQTCYTTDSKDSSEKSDTLEHSDNWFLDVCPLRTFHFFNVDYVILATILAKHLESNLEHEQQKWPKQPNFETHCIMYYRFVQYETVAVDWHLIEKSLQNVLKNDAEKYLKALKNILKNDSSSTKPEIQWKLLCLGCPLTPVLRSILLKYYAEKDLELNRESHENTLMVEVYVPKDSERRRRKGRGDDKVYVHGDYVISIVPRKNYKGYKMEGDGRHRIMRSFATFLSPYNSSDMRSRSRSPSFSCANFLRCMRK